MVAAGANQFSDHGSPTETIVHAMRELTVRGGVIRACSRLFKTPCFPPGAGPDFVNAAFLLEMPGGPERVLEHLHQVERALGRRRAGRWGQRTVDLDLLGWGQQVRPDPATVRHWIDMPLDEQMRVAPDTLLLPHPRIQDRAFVLVPLMDIAPDWVHPLLGRTVRQMHDALPHADREAARPLVFPPQRQ